MAFAMTATGLVPVDELGLTLMHEHVLVDVTCYWDPASDEDSQNPDRMVTIDLLGRLRHDPVGVTRQNLVLDDVGLAVEELAAFRRAGGRTIVDLTPRGAGPRVGDVARVAAEAGVRVVFGTGFYLESTQPESVVTASEHEIAERLVSDILEGIDGGSIRAGIIGEIGTCDPIRPTEIKVLRAAALAQRETGAALNVHLEEWGGNGSEVLDIIESQGGDLTRVILSHLDSRLDLSYHSELAVRGAYIEYDLFGTEEYRLRESRHNPTDRERIIAIRELIDQGFASQILISTDICTKTQLIRFGGYGYQHIPATVAPMMVCEGVEQEAVDLFLHDNPARVLTLAS